MQYCYGVVLHYGIVTIILTGHRATVNKPSVHHTLTLSRDLKLQQCESIRLKAVQTPETFGQLTKYVIVVLPVYKSTCTHMRAIKHFYILVVEGPVYHNHAW